MGLRYEKDTILNWINEMGKFLRLLVEKWEGKVAENDSQKEREVAYQEFFKKQREEIQAMSDEELLNFASTLEDEQIRPLAILMAYDGLIAGDKLLLRKSKSLFSFYSEKTGNFSFEDLDLLSKIDKALAD